MAPLLHPLKSMAGFAAEIFKFHFDLYKNYSILQFFFRRIMLFFPNLKI